MADAKPGAEYWTALGWQPSTEQLDQLAMLQDLLREWNEKVNITRLVDGDDYWINQVFDSLWPLAAELKTPHQSLTCIDVGTGGGFPVLAIAIALPGSQMTLLDSVGRKTAAVEEMASRLGLADRVAVRTERIETTEHDRACRGRFDLAMARAVAAAHVVAEYLVPLLKPRGEALLFRGQWSEDDTAQFSTVLTLLKAQLTGVQACQLPAERGIRHLLRVQPIGSCPSSYPRAVGIPSRTHLGS